MINDVTLRKSPIGVRIYIYLLRMLFPILEWLSTKLASRLALRIFLTPPQSRASRWERSFEQRGTRDVVRLGSKRLRLLRHGAGSKTALLVHGWGSRSTQLGSYAESLISAGYCVYSLDGPAHGESTGSSTDMIEFANGVALAAEQLSDLDVVVGHSFGAACTLLATDRFALKTKRLVLISCFADVRFIMEAFARFFRIGMPVVDDMRRQLEHRYKNTVRLDQVSPRLLIRNYRKPVLLIHDQDDEEVPIEHARTLQSGNANVRLFATEKLGHRKILRDDSAISAIVAFLNEATPLPVA
jgi:pimeloyl-ACP methyl ester carboxylesterase